MTSSLYSLPFISFTLCYLVFPWIISSTYLWLCCGTGDGNGPPEFTFKIKIEGKESCSCSKTTALDLRSLWMFLEYVVWRLGCVSRRYWSERSRAFIKVPFYHLDRTEHRQIKQMVKVQLDLTDQMELDHKLEIVCDRRQHGIENTEWQITGDQKGRIERKEVQF